MRTAGRSDPDGENGLGYMGMYVWIDEYFTVVRGRFCVGTSTSSVRNLDN